jgi:hypothetical protein
LTFVGMDCLNLRNWKFPLDTYQKYIMQRSSGFNIGWLLLSQLGSTYWRAQPCLH